MLTRPHLWSINNIAASDISPGDIESQGWIFKGQNSKTREKLA
jgi:hypothetical protein